MEGSTVTDRGGDRKGDYIRSSALRGRIRHGNVVRRGACEVTIDEKNRQLGAAGMVGVERVAEKPSPLKYSAKSVPLIVRVPPSNRSQQDLARGR